jgi:hypothetical protein
MTWLIRSMNGAMPVAGGVVANTCPVCTSRAASRARAPWRTYSCSTGAEQRRDVAGGQVLVDVRFAFPGSWDFPDLASAPVVHRREKPLADPVWLAHEGTGDEFVGCCGRTRVQAYAPLIIPATTTGELSCGDTRLPGEPPWPTESHATPAQPGSGRHRGFQGRPADTCGSSCGSSCGPLRMADTPAAGDGGTSRDTSPLSS